MNSDRSKEIRDDVKAKDVWQDLHSELQEFQRTEPLDDNVRDEERKDCFSSVASKDIDHELRADMPWLWKNLSPSTQNLAKYRLPAALERLNSTFKSLGVLYRFLSKNFIQTSWLVVRDALRRLCQDEALNDEDLLCIAEIGRYNFQFISNVSLCFIPSLVILKVIRIIHSPAWH